jgi:glycosyltransferase involved in cell wall biosynthesis
MLVASGLEHAHLTWQRRTEDYGVLADSRFTVPVSVIAPAFDERTVIVPSIRSLLAFDYPQFEVIVVNDGSRDDTLAVLQRAFDLERRDSFYRKQFDSRRVRGIYRSRTHPNLTVVDKENGGKADALNAGLKPRPLPLRLHRGQRHRLLL